MKVSLVVLAYTWAACLAATVESPAIDALEVKTRAAGDRGSYTVSGLGNRKKAIIGAGGNTLDLAIAMLETENMGTNYPYGDNKSGDSANFGVFKQNWGMLRVCASRAGFVGQSASQYNNRAKLKYADVR
jgi:hypothetical protein